MSIVEFIFLQAGAIPGVPRDPGAPPAGRLVATGPHSNRTRLRTTKFRSPSTL